MDTQSQISLLLKKKRFLKSEERHFFQGGTSKPFFVYLFFKKSTFPVYVVNLGQIPDLRVQMANNR